MAHMAMREATRHHRRAAEELLALARNLTALAGETAYRPEAVKDISRGLLELSQSARRAGEARTHMAARALAAILDGLDRRPEGDAPFILETARNFLESIRVRAEWGSNLESA